MTKDIFLELSFDDLQNLSQIARFSSITAISPRGEAGCAVYANTAHSQASTWLLVSAPMTWEAGMVYTPSRLIHKAFDSLIKGEKNEKVIFFVENDRIGYQLGEQIQTIEKAALRSRPYRANFDAARRWACNRVELVKTIASNKSREIDFIGRDTRLKIGDGGIRVRPGRLGAPRRVNYKIDALLLGLIIMNLPQLKGAEDLENIYISAGQDCLLLSNGYLEVVIPSLIPMATAKPGQGRPYFSLATLPLERNLKVEAIAEERDFNFEVAEQLATALEWQQLVAKLTALESDQGDRDPAIDTLAQYKPQIEALQRQGEPIKDITAIAAAMQQSIDGHEAKRADRWLYAF